jgi:hypothetical protein
MGSCLHLRHEGQGSEAGLEDLEAEKAPRCLEFDHVADMSAKQCGADRRQIRDASRARVGLADSHDPVVDHFAAIEVAHADAFADADLAVGWISMNYLGRDQLVLEQRDLLIELRQTVTSVQKLPGDSAIAHVVQPAPDPLDKRLTYRTKQPQLGAQFVESRRSDKAHVQIAKGLLGMRLPSWPAGVLALGLVLDRFQAFEVAAPA